MSPQQMPYSDRAIVPVAVIAARVVCVARGHHWRSWQQHPTRFREYRNCLRCWKREERHPWSWTPPRELAPRPMVADGPVAGKRQPRDDAEYDLSLYTQPAESPEQIAEWQRLWAQAQHDQDETPEQFAAHQSRHLDVLEDEVDPAASLLQLRREYNALLLEKDASDAEATRYASELTAVRHALQTVARELELEKAERKRLRRQLGLDDTAPMPRVRSMPPPRMAMHDHGADLGVPWPAQD
ncbi:MAG TPA: hypothetical protein VL738_01680 [Dactylosporangium sp.]|nr:hypothetical protein [Dactylosporangium sp.]